MKEKRNFVKPLITAAILVVLIAGMALVYLQVKPHSAKGSKEIIVDVVIPDEETKEFTLDTNAEFLRQALEDKELIKGQESDYGLYITEVNGHVANDADQEWWCITQDGQQINFGVDQIAIHDGDHYEITLTKGY